MTAKQSKPGMRSVQSRIQINALVEAVWKPLTDALMKHDGSWKIVALAFSAED